MKKEDLEQQSKDLDKFAKDLDEFLKTRSKEQLDADDEDLKRDYFYTLGRVDAYLEMTNLTIDKIQKQIQKIKEG